MKNIDENLMLSGFQSKCSKFQIHIYNNPVKGAFRYIYIKVDSETHEQKNISYRAVKSMVKHKRISEFASTFC